jgi:hypothetical protein
MEHVGSTKEMSQEFDYLRFKILRLRFDSYGDVTNLKEKLLFRLNGYMVYYDKYTFLAERYPSAATKLDDYFEKFLSEFLSFKKTIIDYSKKELRKDAPNPLENYKVYDPTIEEYPPMRQKQDNYQAQINAAIDALDIDKIAQLIDQKDSMSFETRMFLMKKVSQIIMSALVDMSTYQSQELPTSHERYKKNYDLVKGLQEKILPNLDVSMTLALLECFNNMYGDLNLKRFHTERGRALSFNDLLKEDFDFIKDINTWKLLTTIFSIMPGNSLYGYKEVAEPKKDKVIPEKEFTIRYDPTAPGGVNQKDLKKLLKCIMMNPAPKSRSKDSPLEDFDESQPTKKVRIYFEEGITEINLPTLIQTDEHYTIMHPDYEYDIKFPSTLEQFDGLRALPFLRRLDLSHTRITSLRHDFAHSQVVHLTDDQSDYFAKDIVFSPGLQELFLPATYDERYIGSLELDAACQLKLVRCSKNAKKKLLEKKPRHFSIEAYEEVSLSEIESIIKDLIEFNKR